MNKKIIVAPSILSADFSDIRGALSQIKDSGSQWVHIDVMDGVFVPNLTFGPKFVKDMKPYSDLFFDAHLMMSQPEVLIEEFAKAGCDAITVHQEACTHLDKVLQQIKGLGLKAGVAVCPSTPVSQILPILDIVDIVLIMSVNPGFGGQSFIPYTLEKVKELDSLRNGRHYLISIDGGINDSTISQVAKAGIDVVVTGSAFFKENNQKSFVERMSMPN